MVMNTAVKATDPLDDYQHAQKGENSGDGARRVTSECFRFNQDCDSLQAMAGLLGDSSSDTTSPGRRTQSPSGELCRGSPATVGNARLNRFLAVSRPFQPWQTRLIEIWRRQRPAERESKGEPKLLQFRRM